jgi:vancomycin aglycone glucosyltransferase
LKILLAPHGTRGDVQPMIALAHGLHARGHFVRFVAPVNFVEWIRRSGFACEPDGVDVEAVLRSGHADLQSLRRQVEYLSDELAPRLFDTVPRAAESADLIVGAGVQIAGASAAELRGIPFISAVFCPSVVPGSASPPPTVRTQTLPPWVNRLLWRFSLPIADLALGGAINAGRARLGLAALRSPMRRLGGSGVLLAADPDLAPAAGDEWLPVTQTGPWILADASPLDARVEAFLRAGPPPVYVGFGSMVAKQIGGVTASILHAARTIGCRLIVSSGWAAVVRGPEWTDAILDVGDVPHAALFPRVAAVVHHGGAGTTTTAARAGVPQVILPHILDQFYWAHRVERLGLGPAAVPVDRVTPDQLTERIGSVIADATYAARARELGLRIASRDGVDAAVRHLERADAHCRT